MWAQPSKLQGRVQGATVCDCSRDNNKQFNIRLIVLYLHCFVNSSQPQLLQPLLLHKKVTWLLNENVINIFTSWMWNYRKCMTTTENCYHSNEYSISFLNENIKTCTSSWHLIQSTAASSHYWTKPCHTWPWSVN